MIGKDVKLKISPLYVDFEKPTRRPRKICINRDSLFARYAKVEYLVQRIHRGEGREPIELWREIQKDCFWADEQAGLAVTFIRGSNDDLVRNPFTRQLEYRLLQGEIRITLREDAPEYAVREYNRVRGDIHLSEYHPEPSGRTPDAEFERLPKTALCVCGHSKALHQSEISNLRLFCRECGDSFRLAVSDEQTSRSQVSVP